MDHSRDVIEWVGHDMALKILMYLEDPSDLVRASAVSSSWRRFGEFFRTDDPFFWLCHSE